MLRGAQTPGELKLRTERLHQFGSTEEVERLLEQLAGRELARDVGRRPGQKEDRWAQLLGSDEEPAPAAAPEPSSPAAPRSKTASPPSSARSPS